jgi:hypothetical protein
VSEPLLLAQKAMRNARSASVTAQMKQKISDPPTTPPIAPINHDTAPDGLDGAVGVLEHNDWSGDIEGDVGRNITRLANLAVDDHQRDPSKSAESHYRARLGLLLNDKNQRFLYGDVGMAPLPSTVEPSTPTHLKDGKVHANYVTSYEFNLLSQKVESMNQLIRQLMKMHHESEAKIKVLEVDREKGKQEITLLKAEVLVLKLELSKGG